jgi:hypothetical protein
MTDAVLERRLTEDVLVVISEDAPRRLECLKAGSILTLTSHADSAGMIQATCADRTVFIFRRDLDERSIEMKPTGEDTGELAGEFTRGAPPLSWRLANGSQ